MFESLTGFFVDKGVYGLGLLSFIESSVFPIPPDFLLAGMVLSTPQKAMWFALICTVASSLGGGLGYGIGKFGGRPAFDMIFGKDNKNLVKVEKLYNKYGVWAVLGAAFTPLPYKVFTIASGVFRLNFLGFMLASFVGRGSRFFLVALGLYFFGEAVKQYTELVIIGLSLFIALFFFVVWKKRKKLAA